MMRQPKDNHREITQLATSRILQSPLAQYARPEHLRRIAALEDQSAGLFFLSVEFIKAGTNCFLDVRLEVVDRPSPVIDEEGNELVQLKLTCGVNFPSYGNTDLPSVMVCLRLYQDVAMLAAEIQAEFGGRYIVWKTIRRPATPAASEE